ncbi:MAG: integral rane sensor hybrid histidine kinase [Bacteroidetes bacterium]|nr:integral rane sensor hybrid histidine kinase [Bacteroidota bacterium]
MSKLKYIFVFLLAGKLFAQEVSLKQLSALARNSYAGEDYDSALYYSGRMVARAEKVDSTKYIIRGHYIQGNIYLERKNTKDALEHLFTALKVCKKVKNEIEYEGYILNRIGSIYFTQKNYAAAKSFFKEEVQLKHMSGDSVKVANALLNMSAQYWRLGEYDSAAILLKRAGIIAANQGDSILMANYVSTHANYFFGKFLKENNLIKTDGNLMWKDNYKSTNLRDSAEYYWKRALKLWSVIGGPEDMINPLFNLGYSYQTRRAHQAALNNYLIAKKIADSLKMTGKKLTLYGNIAEVYYDLGKYKESADNLRILFELKDSLQEKEISNYSEKLARQYQMETNRTLVEQDLRLNLQNSEIAEQQKRIYLYVLIFIVLILVIIGIMVYINFNKRVTKKVEEAKEKFFTNIMHEIRTPLSMIQAPLKTLKPKVQDEESLYYINLAEKNVVRLNELINQMLDVSKIDSATYKLNKTVGNLDLFLKETITSFEKLATEKDINFISSVNLSDTLLVFDKDALEKIITNLLSNAIKYTKAKGSVGLNFNSEEKEDSSKLTIEVWDTGIGIPISEQPKIFDRFFRSESSINKASGVGIGLSLVKDLVDAYGGKINFTSEENKGTKFVVELTLKHPEQLAEQVAVSAESDKALIMLIEDDEDILDFVGNLLKSQYEIVKARNGNLAKMLLKNITPDLIVTDLMMDELDGLSFIKEIKTNKGLNHIPVIVLSAKSSGQTRVEVLNAGAQAFMTKPFLPEELNSVITNQIELITGIKKEFKSKVETEKPDQTPEEKFSSSEPYTQKLFDLIFKQLDNSELSVESLADQMATNRSHFQRKIKSLTGYSPSELIKLIRLEKSKQFLLAKKGNITEVAYMCGFSSQSYFTKCFTQHFGYSPTQAVENKNK